MLLEPMQGGCLSICLQLQCVKHPLHRRVSGMPILGAYEARWARTFSLPAVEGSTLSNSQVMGSGCKGTSGVHGGPPRQISHACPSGFLGGGCEQDFSTTRHHGGTLALSWTQPPWEWKVVPFAVVQL